MSKSASELLPLRDERSVEIVEPTMPAPSLKAEVFSWAVNAEIRVGETLVTGGYRTDDGNYELTFLTPRTVVGEGGRESISVDLHILSFGPEFAKAQGLESLVANNGQPQSEAWKMADTSETLAAVGAVEGTRLVSLAAPWPLRTPSDSFVWQVSNADRTQNYTLNGTVSRRPDGSFSIKSLIERTAAATSP